MFQHAADGAVDLGHAAQAVGVLHAGVVFSVGFADLGAVEQAEQMLGCGHLAGVRARLVNAGIEGGGRAHQRFEGHGSGYIGEMRDAQRAGDGESADGGHGLGAVEQGQALLGGKGERLQAGAAEGFSAGQAGTLMEGFTLADDDQGEMSERSQIAACAH